MCVRTHDIDDLLPYYEPLCMQLLGKWSSVHIIIINYVLAIAHVLNISILNYCASISRAIAAHRGDRVSLIMFFFLLQMCTIAANLA